MTVSSSQAQYEDSREKMNGFDKNKDFIVLQKEYGFVPLFTFWNKYRIQYAKRIRNDIFAFLVL